MNYARPKEAASHILKQFSGKILAAAWKQSGLLVYDSALGAFRWDDHPLRLCAKKLLGASATIHKIAETLEFVKLEAPRVEASQLDRPGLLAFANGVLDLETSELKEHSPEHRLTTRIPHDWKPEARCPRFDSFLEEVLEPEYHPLIEELMGCALAGDIRHETIFLLYGAGSNGKSVLLKTLRVVLGAENVSNASLHQLADRHFALAELEGKRLNFHTDIDSASPRSLSLLKALASGDPLHAERKYEQPFPLVNRAALMFSCNALPAFRERGHAVVRRFMVIPFDRVFAESERDLGLAERLAERDEVEGIIQRAVTGYRRYRHQGLLSVPRKSRHLWAEHLEALNPCAEFLAERVEKAEGDRLAKNELYGEFKEWCRTTGERTPSRRQFSKTVRERFPQVSEGKVSASDRRRCWVGIRLKQQLREAS